MAKIKKKSSKLPHRLSLSRTRYALSGLPVSFLAAAPPLQVPAYHGYFFSGCSSFLGLTGSASA